MKPNPGSENQEDLGKILRKWSVKAPLPPRFQEQVWRRIADATSADQPTLAGLFVKWLERSFTRPALAASYVALLLAAGLATGYLRAHEKSAKAESQWRALYVQSVDPYQMPRQ